MFQKLFKFIPAMSAIKSILLIWDSWATIDTAMSISTAKLLKYDGNRQKSVGLASRG